MSHLVLRSQVKTGRQYNQYRTELRIDFWFSCAYCTMTELEASGIGFCIDHYEPQTMRRDLINSYSNLMWSCEKCNGLKSDYPSREHRSLGFRFIRVDTDDYLEHFKLEDEYLRPLTAVGKYSHMLLNLDSMRLRRMRSMRQRAQNAADAIAGGVRYLQNISIDQLPRVARLRFTQLRSELVENANSQRDIIERVLRELAQSPNLDPDPSAFGALSDRRRFLRTLGAPDFSDGS